MKSYQFFFLLLAISPFTYGVGVDAQVFPPPTTPEKCFNYDECYAIAADCDLKCRKGLLHERGVCKRDPRLGVVCCCVASSD
ncbi:hypothetical protein Nepgr_026187 [Nepenthes gracilis]|uniref:Uncharacterized protein n=1 Tax=Nepenthes gracilis TaxID=150966 RepID=A0AAD3Y1U6_NEPGR|nr:hypothetical protein Nepgr_026187 [Nepenthes gracilis]